MTNKKRVRFSRKVTAVEYDGDTIHLQKIKEPNNNYKKNSKSTNCKTTKTTPPTKELVEKLADIKGVGTSKAKKLISEGLTKVSQLSSKKWNEKLPKESQLWLSLKPLKKIPHKLIQFIEPYLTKSNTKYEAIIVGSYRRGSPYSRDIDIIVVKKKKSATIQHYIESVKEIFDPGNVHVYSEGDEKISFIVDITKIIKSKTKTLCKVDAFLVSKVEKIPMLLYTTGNKNSNIIMRVTAKKQGYLLNRKGLYRLSDNSRVPGLNSEKAYYDILSMTYKDPADRSI